jgi:hypothetical protein
MALWTFRSTASKRSIAGVLARQMSEPNARAALLDITAFLKDRADRLKSKEHVLEQAVTSEETPPLVPSD